MSGTDLLNFSDSSSDVNTPQGVTSNHLIKFCDTITEDPFETVEKQMQCYDDPFNLVELQSQLKKPGDQSETKVANLLNLDETLLGNISGSNKENLDNNVTVEKKISSPTGGSNSSPVRKNSKRPDLYKMTLVKSKDRSIIDNLADEEINLVDSLDSDSDLDDFKIPFLQNQENLKMSEKKSEVISKLNEIKKNSHIPEKSNDLKQTVAKLKEIVMANDTCDAQTRNLMNQLCTMIDKQEVLADKNEPSLVRQNTFDVPVEKKSDKRQDPTATLIRQGTFDKVDEPTATLVRQGTFDKEKEVDSGCDSSSFLSSCNSSSENTHLQAVVDQLSKALGNVNLNVMQMNQDSAAPAIIVVVNQNDLPLDDSNSPPQPVQSRKSTLRRSQSFKPVVKNKPAAPEPPVLTRSVSFINPNLERRRSITNTYTPVLPRKSLMQSVAGNRKCPEPSLPPRKVTSAFGGNKPGVKNMGPMKATAPLKPLTKPTETFTTPKKPGAFSRFPVQTPLSSLGTKTQPIAQSTPMMTGTPIKSNRTSLVPPNSSNIQRRSLVSTPTRPQPNRPVSVASSSNVTNRRPSLSGRPQSTVPTTRSSTGLQSAISRLSFLKPNRK